MINLLLRNSFNLFIQTSKTPNPNFLKFIPVSKSVMGSYDPVDISSIQDASRLSPLARRIFRIQGITQVFYGKDYISIAKQQKYNWTELKPLLFGLIQQHYQSGQPLIVNRQNNDDLGISQNDTETVKMIKQILSSRIRPFVQDDGGDVQFVQFQEQTGTLKLKMLGSCSGCPSETATLRNGILKAMVYYVGEVKNIVSVGSDTKVGLNQGQGQEINNKDEKKKQQK